MIQNQNPNSGPPPTTTTTQPPQGGPGRPPPKQQTFETRVNRRIRVREVRVIGADGSQLGILPTEEALRRAEEDGLDLVEVSPTARPPVCKIMDYGKFKYQQKRNASEQRKKQTTIEVKEVKFRPKTDKHDFDVKVERVRRFIGDGNKCKVTIMFRGREIVHPEIGQDILVRVAKLSEDVAMIESSPRMEGRQMFMIVSPNRAGAKKRPDGTVESPREQPETPRPPTTPFVAPRGGPEITRAPQLKTATTD